MTQTLPPALFRFVGVRRPAPPQRDLPPPPDDVIDRAFDFTDALLPVVAQVLHRDDRELAAKLVTTLLHRMPKAAAGVRKLHRRAAIDDTLTLGDVRSSPVDGAPLNDLAQRAATVVVLERWLGNAQSPQMAKAAGLLRGIAIARLAATPLDDRYLVADLVRGHTIELPDVVRESEPKPQPGLQPQRVRDDLRRLTARSAALGHDDDPPLDTLRGTGFSDLAPHAERVVEAAGRVGLPANAPASKLARILDAEIGNTPTASLPDNLPTFPVPLPPPSLPVFSGRARVLGRGDLMVVRLTHLRYQMNEIAYVENVLRSELRGRTVIVDTRTSEKVVDSASEFSEATQELTTDERFELQDATSSTNSSTNSMSAGVSVSGGWGPVSVGVDVNASHSTSTSETNSSSSSYAKDVTDRATQTMRSESSTKTVTTTSTRNKEENKHDFDNRSGTEHVRGVYRWLDKVDLAQVYNYGERLLLEFVVAEPAAQHVYLQTNYAAAGQPQMPLPLDFRPSDITEHNFVTFGRRYDTPGLSRPPAATIAIPATFAFQPARTTEEVHPDPDHPVPIMMANGVTTGEVAIPDGYAAGTVVTSVVYGGSLAVGEKPPEGSGVPEYVLQQAPVNIAVGGQRFSIWAGHTAESVVTDLESRRTGNLPVAIGSQQIDGQAIAMRVIAYRTDEAFKKWQQDTFEAIQNAYLAKQSDYENSLAVSAMRTGYAGVAPTATLRGIEVAELTRCCQTVLTGQDFTEFGSVEVTETDLPKVDLDEQWIEADAIQFFSDVFDWSLMTYVFYPYQWAGRHRWPDLSGRTSPDPVHQSFLQAGAARVVVPVRDGYEHAVARYLRTGDVPSWGPEPWKGRPVHHPTVDELIADANDRPQGEVAVDEPWEVVSPTTLVYLQEDAALDLTAPADTAPADTAPADTATADTAPTDSGSPTEALAV